MVASVLRSFAVEAAILFGTFVAAWAAAFCAIYWIAGGQAGIIQGWGLILILVPFVVAAFAVKAVGAMRMKRRGNELVRGLLLRAKDHPMFAVYHQKFAARGLRICLNCGEFSLNPLARACSACKAAFPAVAPESDHAQETGDGPATCPETVQAEPAAPAAAAPRERSATIRYREIEHARGGDE